MKSWYLYVAKTDNETVCEFVSYQYSMNRLVLKFKGINVKFNCDGEQYFEAKSGVWTLVEAKGKQNKFVEITFK